MADKSFKAIFENNKIWVEKRLQENPDFFKILAKDQNPEFLYIGCSDSRVTSEELMGLNPGEVFVRRNVGNLVNALDLNATSVIQYAVEHLRVKHIIVCGHYHCGAIKSAMSPKDFGLLNPWLRTIRDVYRLHQNELDAITDEHQRSNRLVELNVQEQCINIIKLACIQKRYLTEHFPIVHGLVFDIETGQLKDLDLDFDSILKNIQKIYNLTNSQWSNGKNR